MRRYNFKNIRCLLEKFTDEELRRLCYDTPDFRPVYDRLRDTDKAHVISWLIEHAQRSSQLDTLLTGLRELKPTHYEQHKPYYEGIVSRPRYKRLGLSFPLLNFIGLGLGVVCLSMVLAVAYASGILSPTQETQPTTGAKMTGSLRIAVAGFAQTDHPNGSDLGAELAQEVALKLAEKFKSFGPGTDVTVWGPDRVGLITGQNEDEWAASAAQIAQTVEADIVVYGALEATHTVTPKFKLSTQRFEGFYEVEELTGQQAIGAPLSLAEQGDFIDREEAGRRLATGVEVLANVLYGLGSYYNRPADYPQALARFQAADVAAWPDQQGKHILYVLLGNAAGKTGDLKLAETYYEKAREVRPDYADAYLGLANVYFFLAITHYQQAEEPKNPADIDQVKLDQAIATYEQAKTIALDSPVQDLATKADFGLGECYIYKITVTADEAVKQAYYASAIKVFKEVILDYAGGEEPLLRDRAAEAHARLGLLYKDHNANCALKEYQAAVALLSETSPNRDTYATKIAELTGHANADQCTR